MRARAVSVVLAAAFALLAVPAAHAADPLTDYTANGSIDPCDYSVAELKAAKAAITPNVRSYASDYPKALKAALRARKRDDCATGGAGAPLTPSPAETPTPTPAATAPAATPPPAVATTPAAGRAAGEDPDLTGALVVFAVLGAVLLLALLLALLVSRFGRDEGRLAPANQAWREARWRAGGVWADFRDWLSLGR